MEESVKYRNYQLIYCHVIQVHWLLAFSEDTIYMSLVRVSHVEEYRQMKKVLSSVSFYPYV